MSDTRAATPSVAIYAAVAAIAAAELVILVLALNPTATGAYRDYYLDRTTTCLDRDTAGEYRFGDTVSFLPDGWVEARAVRVCGWDGPADNGTHSIGTSSRLRVKIPEGVPAVTARFDLAVAPAARGSQQRVHFRINGQAAHTATLPPEGETRVEFAVPPAILGSGPATLDIELRYPDAVQPERESSETRKRAVLLRAFSLS